MTETITTNENQPKEEKIKRLIQRRIDELEKQYWQFEREANYKMSDRVAYVKVKLQGLLKEIETL